MATWIRSSDARRDDSEGVEYPRKPAANCVSNMRLAIDVGRWGDSRWSLAGGQSGNPLSPHYADLLPLWARAEGIPIAWTPEAVASAAVSTLRLQP